MQRIEAAIVDRSALNKIALMLGSASEWRSPADYLEDIADIVAGTGRPHPGDRDPEQYDSDLADWIIEDHLYHRGAE